MWVILGFQRVTHWAPQDAFGLLLLLLQWHM
jgi:hypothetical protein